MRLPPGCKSRLEKGKLLKELTTFRVGGPAAVFARPSNERELSELLRWFRSRRVPVRVIGAGSNILADDRGVRGAVIKPDGGSFRAIRITGTRVRAGAGAPLASLIRKCARAGLTGMEFLAGIPGTVGGGLAMNCGVSSPDGARNIGDIVEEATVMGYNGVTAVIRREEMAFGYRSSSLSRAVIIAACFRLRKSSPEKAMARVREWIERRKGQEYGFPSAGCVFRNPPGASAGKLIDECGLKGRRVGGALVSVKHANFIVNAGGARCSEILALMRIVRKEVERRRGIRLRPEIKLWRYE